MKKEKRQETEYFSDSKIGNCLNTASNDGCTDSNYTDKYQVPKSVKQRYFKLKHLHSKIIINNNHKTLL